MLAGEKGNAFAKEFIQKTGTVAVIIYSELVGWVDSLLIHTLFLSRFFSTDGNKFERVQEIYASVITDYPRAKDSCGFSLFLNKDQNQ